MSLRASTLLLAALVCACAGQGDAPRSPAGTPPLAPTQVLPGDETPLRAALAAAEAGQPEAGIFAALGPHPARAWVEYALLLRQITTLEATRADAFLHAQGSDAVALRFRQDWLAELARRSDWQGFLRHWQPHIERPALRCLALEAHRQSGKTDARWQQDAEKLWLSGKVLPAECNAPLAHWQSLIPPATADALRWQRIDLALGENQPALIRQIAAGFAPAAATLAHSYAAALAGELAAAPGWPRDARSRRVAVAALIALAKQSPDKAEAALAEYGPMLALTAGEEGQVRHEIALQTAASYLPESARRLAAVPALHYDERLHQLALREALARRDFAAALDIIGRFPEALRQKPQNLYFHARLLQINARPGAEALYRQAARFPEFHGFLAADRLKAPYPLCPWTLSPDAGQKQALAARPALVRAFALFRAGRKAWAVAEWSAALQGLDDEGRRLAVALAQEHGWFDRAVFALARDNPEELRLYHLRFPLPHWPSIRQAAEKNAIDPAWIAAEIRAESLFDPAARSPANALGLMQVLPATGEATAAAAGIPWQGATTLLDAQANIAIGSAYLKEMLTRWGHLPQAIAAYNAGPTPTARWQSQRGDFDADFWIETISYRETREYVPRVLAFSVLYDWRMHGDALRLSERIAGRPNGERTGFVCPSTPSPASPSKR